MQSVLAVGRACVCVALRNELKGKKKKKKRKQVFIKIFLKRNLTDVGMARCMNAIY